MKDVFLKILKVKLTLEIWKKMSELLSQSSELENESQVKKQCLAEADAYHNNNFNELNSLFLTNTCELILSNSNNNNKQENNVLRFYSFSCFIS